MHRRNGNSICGFPGNPNAEIHYQYSTLLAAGLAAKAGKASSAAEAKPPSEAVNSISQPSDRPASEYPSWLDNLTRPGRTLGELKRTPAEQRSKEDVWLDRSPAANFPMLFFLFG